MKLINDEMNGQTTPLAHSIPGLAKSSGLSRTTLYKAIKNNQLMTKKFGSRTFVLHEEALRFLRGCRDGR
jgi:hypothetical protein